MTYNAVPSKSTGDLWTAADNNTYIRDNFAATVPDIFTAKGDLAVATAADTAGVLPVGADGKYLSALSSEATGLTYVTPNTYQDYIRYKVSATRSMVNATATIIDYDTKVFDEIGTDSVTTGAAWKFTVPASHTGYFLVTASALLESSTGWAEAEKFELQVFVDGTIYTVLGQVQAQAAASAGFGLFVTGGAIVYAAAASYIDIRGYQNSGGAINVAADGNYSHVAIARLF